ncbi:hypothetical protein Gotri_000023 [Gossypium trilobum]|uniref:Uncharacterized protein n=2 Tax=Gossypium TaxID=3633 RepID=A0A7J9FUM9_9ROSI|nr:hypothetical protein [Gossypium klotzschianum]MBA0788644.1 hypothetical protein [Gossypium trilobum]
MLQKMLNQEEKMHEILTRVHHQEAGSSISIPNFLPPKARLFFPYSLHACFEGIFDLTS